MHGNSNIKNYTYNYNVGNKESSTRYNDNDLLIRKFSSTYFGQFFPHLQELKTEIQYDVVSWCCSRLGSGERQRGTMCTAWRMLHLRERDHWGDTDVDGRIILRWIFRKWEGVVGPGCSWLRIGTGGGHFWGWWGTFGFRKCGEFLD